MHSSYLIVIALHAAAILLCLFAPVWRQQKRGVRQLSVFGYSAVSLFLVAVALTIREGVLQAPDSDLSTSTELAASMPVVKRENASLPVQRSTPSDAPIAEEVTVDVDTTAVASVSTRADEPESTVSEEVPENAAAAEYSSTATQSQAVVAQTIDEISAAPSPAVDAVERKATSEQVPEPAEINPPALASEVAQDPADEDEAVFAAIDRSSFKAFAPEGVGFILQGKTAQSLKRDSAMWLLRQKQTRMPFAVFSERYPARVLSSLRLVIGQNSYPLHSGRGSSLHKGELELGAVRGQIRIENPLRLKGVEIKFGQQTGTLAQAGATQNLPERSNARPAESSPQQQAQLQAQPKTNPALVLLEPADTDDNEIKYVAVNALRLRSAPQLESDVIRNLAKHAQVLVSANQRGWSEISTPAGERGWVASRFLADTIETN